MFVQKKEMKMIQRKTATYGVCVGRQKWAFHQEVPEDKRENTNTGLE